MRNQQQTVRCIKKTVCYIKQIILARKGGGRGEGEKGKRGEKSKKRVQHIHIQHTEWKKEGEEKKVD